MKICLVGYGKMGHVLHSVLIERGHSLSCVVDPNMPKDTATHRCKDVTELDPSMFDVLIDFSSPKSVVDNMKWYAEHDVRAIVGTTGWYDNLDDVKDFVKKSQSGALLWSGNFSLGVNMFWEIVRKASSLVSHAPGYDVFCHEFHHVQKADSPSGTGLMTAKIILDTFPSKKEIVSGPLSRAIRPEELNVTATRGGKTPGIHSVYFDSAADTIEITHTARSREGFALGAVMGAEWLQNKKGYFEIHDFMADVLHI